jgi:hypothetical protein
MLDALRRHASSWMIKLMFAAIIITFVFFFGYSAMRRGGRGDAEAAAALVNGRPIPMAWFQFFFDRNFEQIRSSFKGAEVPDFARNLAISTTLNQLVSRELILEQADELGLVVPDQELARVIVESQKVEQGGEFDPIFYRHRFLPYFKGRYGLDYEEMVRQDLILSGFDQIFQEVDRTPLFKPAVEEPTPRTAWIFEQVVIDPKVLLEAKSITEEREAKEIAADLLLTDPKRWKAKLKKLNITPQRIGPLTIRERKRLIDGQGVIEDFQKILVLGEEQPVIGEAIERGGKIYALRLVDKVEKEEEIREPYLPRPFLVSWMSKLRARAKVKSLIEKEQ